MATVGVLTNSGKALIASRLNGAGSAPTYIGWGTGPGPAEASDSELDTEAPEARVSGTATIETTDVMDDTYQVDGTITATGTRTITEVALFDAPTGGNIFTKVSFDGIPVEADDTIRFVLGYQTTNPS